MPLRMSVYHSPVVVAMTLWPRQKKKAMSTKDVAGIYLHAIKEGRFEGVKNLV